MKDGVVFFAKLLFSVLVAFPFYWINKVLGIAPWWTAVTVIGVVLTAVSLPVKIRLAIFSGLILVGLIVQTAVIPRHPAMTIGFVVTILLLLGGSFMMQQEGAIANSVMMLLGIGGAIWIANVGAGIMLNQAGETAVSTDSVQAVSSEIAANNQPPTVEPIANNPQAAINEQQLTNTSAPSATPLPTVTPNPNVTLTPLPTPEPTRPIAGYGYLEWIEDNGETEWSRFTAYGARANSIAHAFMYDGEGNIVYDTIVEYNGKGYRGPEAEYEKPDDVFRILIIGDSFVEAIQVEYEKTFQALLQSQLSQHDTPERKYEVIAMGRTGWGTVHEAVYFQEEGYKYNADLVILMFYINDVADNFPRFFYPNINNTNYDFVWNEENIQILDTNQEPLPPNNGRYLYNALPPRLQNSNLAQLLIQLTDPPIPVITPGGIITRVHPQFYIYVTEPEVEGYAEGWERTERTLTYLAEDVEASGGQFAVMPFFIGEEMVANVSGWFPELVEGWEWDATLPEQKLDVILEDLPAELWLTRPTYESLADEAEGEVFNLIFFPEDGHFNELGHQWTYEAVYGWLIESDIIEKTN